MDEKLSKRMILNFNSKRANSSAGCNGYIILKLGAETKNLHEFMGNVVI